MDAGEPGREDGPAAVGADPDDCFAVLARIDAAARGGRETQDVGACAREQLRVPRADVERENSLARRDEDACAGDGELARLDDAREPPRSLPGRVDLQHGSAGAVGDQEASAGTRDEVSRLAQVGWRGGRPSGREGESGSGDDREHAYDHRQIVRNRKR